jgi:outer membrane lipoprotein LolB
MTATRVAALAAVVLAAACTTAPYGSPPPDASSLPFDLSGRVLVSYDGRTFSSSLRWQHAPGRDEVWLMSPLGQTLAYIVDEGDGAILTAADRRQYRAASIERITREALGWELPVAHLTYWVQGDVAPGAAPVEVVRDAEQRIARLDQDGWRLVLGYFPKAEFDGRPRRLDLTSGSQQMRLVIDTWRGGASMP